MTAPSLTISRGSVGSILAVAVAGMLAGVAVVAGPSPTAAVGGLAAALALQLLGWQRLLGLLIAATFVTRPRIDVLGVTFRVEHFVLLVCLLAMVRAGRGRALAAAATDRTVVLFGCFIVWSAIVSTIQAPQAGKSLLIVGWLALDWLMLVVFLASDRDAASLAGAAVRWAGVAASVAIVLWVAAQTVGTSLGVFRDASGITAAGLSFEPNLLGATMAIWAFVAFTGVPSLYRRRTALIVTLAVAALVLSLTRSAMVALPLGLAVWVSFAGTGAKVRVLRLLFAGGAIAAAVTLTAPHLLRPVSERTIQALDFSTGTGRNRLESWRTGVNDIRGVAWVVGLGTNSYSQRHLEPTLPLTPTPGYLSNLPLQIVYDTGIVGATLLAAMVASLLTRRRLRDGRGVGLLVVYVVCAAATSPFWYGTTWLLVAIAVLDRRRGASATSSASLGLMPVLATR